MKKNVPALGVGIAMAIVVLLAAAPVLAQSGPAPSGPVESGLRTNRGGVIPPAPADPNGRFSSQPPPPLPGSVETPPSGKVKTEEKVGTPGPGTPAAGTPGPKTPAPTANPKTTPTPVGKSGTPRPTPRPTRRRPTPTPIP